ncbi:MAG: 2-C-methyl-D-erythritol 4-phosphate cytidylyltransferase [Dehalococcoidaceae bacterium]|nr:2-C-methyl-D-erythritol 4-phosphate cytidylyltransferase [Dehalococcoidaceae bacterium]
MLNGEKVSAVILGAGSSRRMGGGDKMFSVLAGKPLLHWSILAFQEHPLVDEIVLVLNSANHARGTRLAKRAGFDKITVIITGGARRQDSVIQGLDHVTGSWVLVHDGARPLVDENIITTTLQAAFTAGAAIPMVPVTDTIKTVGSGLVNKTLIRQNLYAAQTPQAFRTQELIKAYRQIDIELTDDSQAIELTGGRVSLAPGSYDNIKVTTPGDLKLAGILIKQRGGEL